MPYESVLSHTIIDVMNLSNLVLSRLTLLIYSISQVVFTSARKFDGQDYRWVSSGEYIQMSGRAGRRGLDDRGSCYTLNQGYW